MAAPLDMEPAALSLELLPTDPLLLILSFLDYRDLMRCGYKAGREGGWGRRGRRSPGHGASGAEAGVAAAAGPGGDRGKRPGEGGRRRRRLPVVAQLLGPCWAPLANGVRVGQGWGRALPKRLALPPWQPVRSGDTARGEASWRAAGAEQRCWALFMSFLSKTGCSLFPPACHAAFICP